MLSLNINQHLVFSTTITLFCLHAAILNSPHGTQIYWAFCKLLVSLFQVSVQITFIATNSFIFVNKSTVWPKTIVVCLWFQPNFSSTVQTKCTWDATKAAQWNSTDYGNQLSFSFSLCEQKSHFPRRIHRRPVSVWTQHTILLLDAARHNAFLSPLELD